MLLVDDDDELPASPTQGETQLMGQLGAEGLRAVDAALAKQVTRAWLKAARVVFDAVKAGAFSHTDKSHVDLHVRRLIQLVDAGVLEARGDLRRPRWSEVRRAPDSSE